MRARAPGPWPGEPGGRGAGAGLDSCPDLGTEARVPGLSTPVWSASSTVKPLGVLLARSSARAVRVSTLAMWLLWPLRSGNSSSAGSAASACCQLLEKGMAAAGCGGRESAGPEALGLLVTC